MGGGQVIPLLVFLVRLAVTLAAFFVPLLLVALAFWDAKGRRGTFRRFAWRFFGFGA